MKILKNSPTSPTRLDKIIIWFMLKVDRVRQIVELGISEAYDLGFERGMEEMAKTTGGKKYQKKVQKVLKQKYKKLPN